MATIDDSRPQPDWAPELGAPLRRAPIVGYLRAIRAHWVLALLIVLATVGVSAALVAQRSATYVADANLLVSPVSEFDSTLAGLPLLRASGGDPERPVKTAASIIESPDVAEQASSDLGGSPSASEIEDAVEVKARDGENLVAVEATSSDPARAASIANAYARAILEVRREELRPLVAEAITSTQAELESLPSQDSDRALDLEARLADLRSIEDGRDPTLSIATRATEPGSPEEEPAWLILALALVTGVGVAAAVSILIELLVPGPIDDEDETQSILAAPIIARLPRLSGRQATALTGDRPYGTIEGMRTLRGQLEFGARAGQRAAGVNGGPGLRGVIAIASPTAEDGRTSVAVGLALAALAARSKVVVIEANVHNPGLATGLGLDPERDLTALLGSDADFDAAVTPVPAVPGLDVVIAPRIDNLRTAEQLNHDLPRILEAARRFADCVIVDTPPLGFASDVLPILSAADHVVVVVRLRHTRRAELVSAAEALAQRGITPTGIVIVGSPLAEAGRWRRQQGFETDHAASRLPASG